MLDGISVGAQQAAPRRAPENTQKAGYRKDIIHPARARAGRGKQRPYDEDFPA